MELMQAIKERRSIRKYRTDPIPDEMLNTILEAARWAPSWSNTQSWRLVLVRNQETRNKLAGVLKSTRPGGINRASEAIRAVPVVIVACAERGLSGILRAGDQVGKPATDKGEYWYMFDLGLAMQNLTLTAHSLGLGTVHVGMFEAAEVARILGLPDKIVPVELMPLGWPAEKSPVPPRKEMNQLVFQEKYPG
ncbi:MAG: nitroreductase family protein [Dehalococcoidales bacterium]|nr:nitroreductase family protein [Dehalococcoidales bacterium]